MVRIFPATNTDLLLVDTDVDADAGSDAGIVARVKPRARSRDRSRRYADRWRLGRNAGSWRQTDSS